MNWVELAVMCLPEANVDVFGTEASQFKYRCWGKKKIGRTSKSRVGLLDIRCCKTVVGSSFAIFVILYWRIQ